ncbi:hypothetical protein BH10PLA1_BH10PLA1_09590 [soil metagenome]
MILVVDDNPDLADLMVRLLESQGFPAIAVTSGAEALAIVKTITPSAVLLDLMMPDMDGVEVLAHMRLMPNVADVPVVIHTAGVTPELEKAAIELGVKAIITKGNIDRTLIEIRKVMTT